MGIVGLARMVGVRDNGLMGGIMGVRDSGYGRDGGCEG